MQQQPILALPGPLLKVEILSEEGLQIAGETIRIVEEGGQGRGTAWNVWDGAVAAAKFMECLAQTDPQFVHSLSAPRILELRSGTGLAGLAAAAAFHLPVTLTDLADAMPALQRNIELNPTLSNLATAAVCDWHAPCEPSTLGGPFGLVLATDVVWLEELVPPFVSTLHNMLDAGARGLFAYQSRSARIDALMFGLLKDAGVEVQPAERLSGGTDCGPIDIYWLKA